MNKSAIILLTLSLSACVSRPNISEYRSDPSKDPRYTYARQLAQQHQLAPALVQWQILAMIYPDTPAITEQIAGLHQQIDKRISELEKQLARLASGNEYDSRRRLLQLKILALRPDDNPALNALRQDSSKREIAKAERKAQPSVKVAKVEITNPDNERLSDLLAKAEMQKSHGNFTQLLLSVQEIAQLAPQHPDLEQYRYTAWCGLADSNLQQEQIAQGLAFYEKALSFADNTQRSVLLKKIARLRQQESERLYADAMKVFSSDIVQAIALLDQAVTVDSTNMRARQQLLRAETIQKNLNLIRQNQAGVN